MKEQTWAFIKSVVTEEVIITVVVAIKEVLIAKYNSKTGC